MNKFFSRFAAAALAVTTTAVYVPIETFAESYAEAAEKADIDKSCIALYANKNIRLNEKSVTISGGVFSGDKLDLTESRDNLYISGSELSGQDGNECELPDYTDFINSVKPYDFEFEGDKNIGDTVIDLTANSFRTYGELYINHASLSGTGRITASENIKMSIAGDDELVQAFIMSENGDIDIDAANLDYNGIIYAPNGKVKIDAKDINFTGAIYADSIEINGTSLNVEYRNFFFLNCRAHTSSQVYVHKNEKLVLNGSVSYPEAETAYRISSAQGEGYSIANENTLNPELIFSESGEYTVTLSAKLGNKTVSDSVKIVVTDGPVVNYTSEEDFSLGELSSTSGANDELKLGKADGGGNASEKTYTLDAESGIAVKASQSKNVLNSGGDKLDIGYSLEGYGQLATGSGNDVVLCIDNSGSVTADMKEIIKESAVQIIESMGPNDRLGIATLDSLKTNLTSDKETLKADIEVYDRNVGNSSEISNFGHGLKIAMEQIFDEESETRNKYIFLLTDGENFGDDDELAMEMAQLAKESGTKIYSFETKLFSYDFKDTCTMQEVAIETNGAYKLCPNSEDIKTFLLNMAESIYNLAARNVTFTTTVKNADWIRNGSVSNSADSIVYNSDGSATLSWDYSTFDIEQAENIGISLKTGFINSVGYQQITTDTKLISYDSNGVGSVIYLDDIIVGQSDFAGQGKWTSSVFDSGVENCPWSYVKWNADYYGNSAMDIYLSTSGDGVNFSERKRVSNGEEIQLSGRYIRTEVEMKASEDGASPVLYDLTVYSDQIEASDMKQGADVSIRGAHSATAGSPVTVWLDIDGKYDNVTDIQWDLGNGVDVSVPGESILRRTVVFPEDGEQSIGAAVTAGGIRTEVHVNVTILPEESLWQEIENDEIKSVKMTLSEIPDYITNYNDTITFNINFENPEQVAWVRALYQNVTSYGEMQRIALIEPDENNLVTVPLRSYDNTDTIITVDAFDWYGNKTTESHTLHTDLYAPDLILSAPQRNLYPLEPTVITISASDNQEIKEITLTCNGEEVKLEENLTYTFSNKIPGEYLFVAKAADMAGNVTERSVTITVREDARAPYAYLNTPSYVTLGNSAEIKLTAYDNETTLDSVVLTVQKDDEEPSYIFDLKASDGVIEKDLPYTFTPDELGTYVFTADVTDQEGNVTTVTRTVQCNADTSAPLIDIKLSRSEILAGDPTDVTVKVTDDVAVDTVEFFVDGEPAQLSADGMFHYVSDGENVDQNGIKYVEFKVIATDTSGNSRTGAARLKVELEDTVLPNVSISASNRYEYQSETGYMTVSATDNIGIESVVVTVNGKEIEFDENGRFYFDTSEITEFIIVATATDTSGNQRSAEKTVAIVDTTRPVIKFTPDKNSYDTGDSPVISVEVTDNYKLDNVTAALDGEEIETGNGSFECTIKDADAGKYVLTVRAEDIFGNVQETTYNVNVRDTIAPTITASADKERYAKGEIPVISCETSDNVGVTRVNVNMNGKALSYDMETNQVIMPEEVEPGDYTVTVTAYDGAGNASEAAAVTFFVSESADIECPVFEEISIIPEIIRVGDEVTLTVKATDDSGKVIVTVTKDGAALEENAVSGTYTFVPDAVGEITLVIRAEDESGNYTETEGVVNVYRNISNRKVAVDAPTIASPGENISIILSSTDGEPFDSMELRMGQQDISDSLTLNSDGNYQIDFTLNTTGIYTFKATGKDADGYEAVTAFEIQVTGTYESELQTEEMQKALEQTSETMLNDELKALAQSFSSPTEAYEYVYNNINFESYTNSRRGAIGAYELKRGNDFDQASLLIGLLREMGYPAVYAKGEALIGRQQAADLMALDDFDYASQMISSSGRNASILHFEDGTSCVKMDEVFVRVYVPASETGETAEGLKDLGVWANLDTTIKSSVLNAAEMRSEEETEIDMSAALAQSEGTQTGDIIASIQQLAPAISEKTGDTTLTDMFEGPVTITSDAEYVYSREIVQQSFNRLPVDLQYSLYDNSVEIYNAVPVQLSDTVQFVVSNGISGKNLGTFKISEIYNKRMTLGFKGNSGDGTIFDMSKNQIYYNAFLPAIYVDGEVASEYSYREYASFFSDYMIEPEDEYYFFKNNSWRLGEKCNLTTKLITNGRESSWTDELTIGSTYAMVYDTGGVTESQYYGSLYGAAEANGIDVSDPSSPKEAEASDEIINSLNYYDEDKIGSYLAFAGTYYFMNCDTYGCLDAGFSDIELGYDTKMLLTSYRIGSYEDTITGNTTSVIPGRFEIDVNYNNNYCVSRCGDTDARNDHLFSTAYIESYFEGWIWEQLLFSEGASTVSILNKALEDGANLLNINAENVDEMLAIADVKPDEENEIRSSVAEGLSVIIPDKRTTINGWSGTGYIIADFENYNTFVFKISGGLNGGSSTEETKLIDGLKNTPVDMDKLFSLSFTAAQSLFYITLEYNVANEIMPAASALSAASGCGPAAVFIGGMALYDGVKSLVDTINYRAQMLEIFYNYCMSNTDEERVQATMDMTKLVLDMAKNLYDKATSIFEEEKEIGEQIKGGIKTLINDLYSLITGDDDDLIVGDL